MTGVLQEASDQVRPETTESAAQVASGDSLSPFQQQIYETSELAAEGHVVEGISSLGEFLADMAIQRIPDVIAALLAFLVAYATYRLIRTILRRVLRRAKYVRAGVETIVMQAYKLLGMVIISITVLGQLGFNIATIIAGVGIAGLAMSLAARDTLENVMAGVSILADASFAVGDFVTLGQTFGMVEEVTLRSTRLLTPKNEMLIVPNRLMANEAVLSHSAAQMVRVEIPFSIGYPELPDEAREVVLTLTEGDNRLRDDVPSRVVVTSLGDSGVNMALWLYPRHVRDARELRWDYSEQILGALRAAEIEIPFPHIQLKTDPPEHQA